MNEAETRAEHIDPALREAGWGVVEASRVRREFPITLGRIEGHGRRGKALTADYVLEYRNTRLAVIEAKAWDEELTEGVGQAKNYAGRLAVRFAYATNGRGIYGVDMETGREGELAIFPGPEELWRLTFAEADPWRDCQGECNTHPSGELKIHPPLQRRRGNDGACIDRRNRDHVSAGQQPWGGGHGSTRSLGRDSKATSAGGGRDSAACQGF